MHTFQPIGMNYAGHLLDDTSFGMDDAKYLADWCWVAIQADKDLVSHLVLEMSVANSDDGHFLLW